VANDFFNFFRIEILCRLPLLAGGKEFFADCFDWQVAKLPWFLRFQLCHLLSTWQVAKLE
jgi:hypothetical protein